MEEPTDNAETPTPATSEQADPAEAPPPADSPAEPEKAPASEDADDQHPPAPADEEIAAVVEAVLFSSDTPLSPAKLAQVAELPGRREVKAAVARLNERYERMGCTFRIESIAGGYRMMTIPEYHDVVGRLVRTRSESRLSQAALETLAIVAYRQPILRADVEAIRGVACGEVLRKLMEKQLVKIVGRAEILGRPMLYGTTRRFLEVFGLESLKALPKVEELRIGDKAASGQPDQARPPEANEEQGQDEEEAEGGSGSTANAGDEGPEEAGSG